MLQTTRIDQVIPPAPPTPAHLFNIPLELRDEIYGHVFPDQKGVCWAPYLPSKSHRHRCPFNIILCNRQMYQEVRSFLHRRTISFSSLPDARQIIANIPCLHALDFSKVPCIKFEVNLFQYTPTVPDIYTSLVSLCQSLRKVSRIPHIQIECDGILPRTKPPLYINEDDLERGPLNIVLLLQPFNLLHNIGQVELIILGGPLNNLWSKSIALQEFTMRLKKQMEAPSLPYMQHITAIPRLKRHLNKGLLWRLESCRHTICMGSNIKPSGAGRSENDDDVDLRFTCMICRDIFSSRNSLFRHLRTFHLSAEILRPSPQAQARQDRRVQRLYELGIL
jgi:hypothetical protein